MFLSHPSGPPAKTSFLTLLGGGGGGRGGTPHKGFSKKILYSSWVKPVHGERHRTHTYTQRAQKPKARARMVLFYFHSSLCVVFWFLSSRGGCKGSDEERSTWSGGQRATWLWYDTDLDWHRASARASEPQPHIFYFIINFLFSTFSFNNNLLFFYKKRWFYKYHKNTRK